MDKGKAENYSDNTDNNNTRDGNCRNSDNSNATPISG